MEAAVPSSSAANIINEEEEEEEKEEEEFELASSAVDQMPPGFRFHPTDLEIITHYLLNKVIDTRFRAVAIREIDLNKCEPWDLPHKAAKMGENEWFFFFEKETKYPSGSRTNRATASGYWKATGKDRQIYNGKQVVGMKKTLVFYKGRAPKGDKTNWVIHEYRLHGDFSAYNLSHHAKEKWVVCRVFHKRDAIAPLPPLTDYSSLDLTHLKPASTFATDEIMKPSTLMMLQELNQNDHLLSLPHLESNSCSQFYSTPYSLNSHIDSVLPYESQSSLANYKHQDDAWSDCTNFDDKPNSRVVAADIYVGGKEPAERFMCKMEPISFNNSAICPSSRLSTQMNCEKSNKACDEEEGLCFSPTISDIDSLWSYS